MATKTVLRHIKFDDQLDEQIVNIAKKNGESISETVRELVKKGLAVMWNEENTDEIARIVREQLSIVLKPHIERLAALISKTLHMAATSTFLNVQSLQDLVPIERKKEVEPMYQKARKMAVAYAKESPSNFDIKSGDLDIDE